MEKFNYKNLANNMNVVLLRTPMVVPKMSHALSICPPLGLAYVASALQKANFNVELKEIIVNKEIK